VSFNFGPSEQARSSALPGFVGVLAWFAVSCAAPVHDAHDAPAAVAAPKASAPAAHAASNDKIVLGPSVFMSSIPVQVSPRALLVVTRSGSDQDFARALRVRVEVMHSYTDLGELSRRTRIPLVNGVFQLTDLSRLTSRDAPTKRDRQSSFVVDYAEARFADAAQGLADDGKQPSPAAVAAFADHYISEKTYVHAFDVASRVAETHAGDCTEHAVFTTALLRRFGFTARVVLGIVLIGVSEHEGEPRVLAFGHAWVERYEHDGWHIVDTALGRGYDVDPASAEARGLPPGATLRLAYLPINVLKDESASYARTLMDQVGVESVLGLEVDEGDGSK
jgi:transglutaminase-like putative cysteine protease